MTETANATLTALAERPAREWDVEGPTLCHGHAGIIQSTPDTHPAATTAATAVANAFDPETHFGLQHHDHRSKRDEPGFLTGAAGAALALADHTQLTDPAPPARWDCLLNLS